MTKKKDDKGVKSDKRGIAIDRNAEDSTLITGDHNRVQSGGTTFNIKGDIHAGRDVVMGDQTKYNFQELSKAQIDTPNELATALTALQAEIAKMKKESGLTSAQSRNLEAASKQVDSAVQEASKEKPDGAKIKQTLKDAKETFELLGGSIAAAAGAGTVLGNLIYMATQLFGG